MPRLFLFSLTLACCLRTAATALALGADYSDGPVHGNTMWPEGMKEMVNQSNRVHGFWVNGTDVFFFNGDSAAFNQFADRYSKLKGTALRVVLHPGAKKARSPWDMADRDIPVAWTFRGSVDREAVEVEKKDGCKYYTQVDVWLGSPVKLSELQIPAGVEVASGAEIEKFIAERKGK